MRVLVVDDEMPARLRLRQILEDIDGYECVGEASNGEAALRFAEREAPDIVLLDIRMPGMGGIETAHHLNALDQPPAVVFATAYDEYAVDAFDARAVGYVLKPVRRERLQAALEQASRLAAATLSELADASGGESRRQHICAQSQGRMELIPVASIRAFQADQKYVAVQHADGVCLIDESLKSLEAEFGDRFVRIHRGSLVSIAHIEAIERMPDGKSRVRLRGASPDDDNALIISRRHLADVRRRLKGG